MGISGHKRVLSGVDELRAAVRLFDQCREDAIDSFTSGELILIYRAYKRSEWDYAPDRWTEDEIKAALAGHGTGATGER